MEFPLEIARWATHTADTASREAGTSATGTLFVGPGCAPLNREVYAPFLLPLRGGLRFLK
jgi:hypothetical protein